MISRYTSFAANPSSVYGNIFNSIGKVMRSLTFFRPMVERSNSKRLRCMMRVGGSSRKAHRRRASTSKGGRREGGRGRG